MVFTWMRETVMAPVIPVHNSASWNYQMSDVLHFGGDENHKASDENLIKKSRKI